MSVSGDNRNTANPLPVVISTTPSTATAVFGAQAVVEESIVVEAKATVPITSRRLETFVDTTGSPGTVNWINTESRWKLTAPSGVAGNYATLRTHRSLKYIPGVGAGVRLSCTFDDTNAEADSLQLAGTGNAFNGLYFGYNGTSFGVARQHGGLPEILKLTVDTANTAAGANHEIAIVIGSTTYNVELSDATGATSTTGFTAFEIAAGGSDSGVDWVAAGWNVESEGDDVNFVSRGAGPTTPTTFTATAANSGNGLYTFASVMTGVNATYDWTAQASWNGTALDASFDPGNGNVYQIVFQWLGFGAIYYYIVDPVTTILTLVHTNKYSGSATLPSVSFPTMYPQYAVTHTISSGNNTLNMYGSSIAAFKQGLPRAFDLSTFSAVGSASNISANTETVILALRCDDFSNDATDGEAPAWVELNLNKLSLASDSNKAVTFRIYAEDDSLAVGARNPTDTGDYAQWTHVTGSVASAYTTDATTFTNSDGLQTTVVVQKVGGEVIDLTPYDIVIHRTELCVITAETTNATNDIVASVTWKEDI